MKKFCYAIAALFMLTACDVAEKPQAVEDTNVCEKITGVIARERYAPATYRRIACKWVLLEDGKIVRFRNPSDELILAEPGDTLVYQDNGRCLEVRFK